MAQIVSLSVPSVPAGVEGKEEGVGGKREGMDYAGYYSFLNAVSSDLRVIVNITHNYLLLEEHNCHVLQEVVSAIHFFRRTLPLSKESTWLTN